MKIIFIANIRFPTERAHGAQIAKTCEAFVQSGSTVELWVPRRHTGIAGDPASYYGLRAGFPVRRLFTIDSVAWGSVGFFLESALFALSVFVETRRAKADIYYCRDEIVVAILNLFGVPVVWESHTGAWGLFGKFAAQRARRMVVISNGLKEFYIGKGISASKILVAPDGVDLDDFAHPTSKADARARLGLPADASIAMYIGSLGGWKGVDTLYAAAVLVPEHVLIAVIGGSRDEVSKLSAAYPRVRFLGPRPYVELADNQAAADILVLPNTGKNEVSARFTSPLKLFTYMASGVPIVTSDLPSIREVVDEKSAFFVPADSPDALAEGIMQALKNTEDATRRAGAARALLLDYTWTKRAERILAFLKAQT